MIAHPDPALLAGLESTVRSYIESELNVVDPSSLAPSYPGLELTTEVKAWSTARALPVLPVLAPRLGKKMGAVMKAVKTMTAEDIEKFKVIRPYEIERREKKRWRLFF